MDAGMRSVVGVRPSGGTGGRPDRSGLPVLMKFTKVRLHGLRRLIVGGLRRRTRVSIEVAHRVLDRRSARRTGACAARTGLQRLAARPARPGPGGRLTASSGRGSGPRRWPGIPRYGGRTVRRGTVHRLAASHVQLGPFPRAVGNEAGTGQMRSRFDTSSVVVAAYAFTTGSALSP